MSRRKGAAGDPFAVLAETPPIVDQQVIADLVADSYGLSGALAVLYSERDQNFCLETDAGDKYTIKVSNSAEDPLVTEFQTQAILHLEDADPDLPVPRVQKNKSGETSVSVSSHDGRQHRLRVMTWCDGVPLESVNDARVGEALGSCLSRLDIALADFRHPGDCYTLLWDITHASQLSDRVNDIPEEDLRQLCQSQLESFDERISPLLGELRWQVIHNDFNPGNVLVDPENHDDVAGIIDFGDIVRAPLIVDLAVAAAYLSKPNQNPFVEVCDMLRAYTRELPLQSTEVDLLFDLMLTRFAIGITIAGWRATQFPENEDYILISMADTVAKLRQFSALDRKEVNDLFAAACERST